jgi:predicted nucleic acid-binding protein
VTELFIDTDVIIDFLIDRKPFSREAAIIFTLMEQKKIKGHTSSLTFSNLYYVLRKGESHNKIISKLECLSKMLSILKVEEQTIKKSLASGFPDFEDSIQYFCAKENRKINAIITRNTKDFRNSEIPVMTPGDYLKTEASFGSIR